MGTGSKLGLVLLLASGCVTFDAVGPDDPPEADPVPPAPPGGTDAARRAFTQNVHPILSGLCSGCHLEDATPFEGWLSADPDKAYVTLLTTYADYLGYPRFSPDAPLITAPQQTGQASYSAEQLDTIYDWFQLESR